MDIIAGNRLGKDGDFWYSAVGLVAFSALILTALDEFELAIVFFGLAFTLFAVASNKIGEEK